MSGLPPNSSPMASSLNTRRSNIPSSPQDNQDKAEAMRKSWRNVTAGDAAQVDNYNGLGLSQIQATAAVEPKPKQWQSRSKALPNNSQALAKKRHNHYLHRCILPAPRPYNNLPLSTPKPPSVKLKHDSASISTGQFLQLFSTGNKNSPSIISHRIIEYLDPISKMMLSLTSRRMQSVCRTHESGRVPVPHLLETVYSPNRGRNVTMYELLLVYMKPRIWGGADGLQKFLNTGMAEAASRAHDAYRSNLILAQDFWRWMGYNRETPVQAAKYLERRLMFSSEGAKESDENDEREVEKQRNNEKAEDLRITTCVQKNGARPKPDGEYTIRPRNSEIELRGAVPSDMSPFAIRCRAKIAFHLHAQNLKRARLFAAYKKKNLDTSSDGDDERSSPLRVRKSRLAPTSKAEEAEGRKILAHPKITILQRPKD